RCHWLLVLGALLVSNLDQEDSHREHQQGHGAAPVKYRVEKGGPHRAARAEHQSRRQSYGNARGRQSNQVIRGGFHASLHATPALAESSQLVLVARERVFFACREYSFLISVVPLCPLRPERAPTQRPLRRSVCSVLRLEKHSGHRESRFGCGSAT